MRGKKWVAVALVLVAFFLFVPFVPYTRASGQYFGAHYQVTADVSPSYYLTRCGSYINSQAAAQLASGFSGFYQLSRGYTFTCNFQAQ
ncbi:MAG: hypothetical protein HY296_08210 [Thaumarchaeota archaeon]|nr:hypothetical protein [Nitrososphaerota archaeon]